MGRGRREWQTSPWAWGLFDGILAASAAATLALVVVLVTPRLREAEWLRSRLGVEAVAGAVVVAGGLLGTGGLVVRAARAGAFEASIRRGVPGDLMRGAWLLAVPVAALGTALLREETSTSRAALGWIALYLAWAWGACSIAFLTYGADKYVAIERGRGRPEFSRRVPEAVLQSFALLGGLPGSLLAQRVFRHKTSGDKRGFRAGVWGMAIIHYACVAGVVYLLASREGLSITPIRLDY